LNQHNGDDAPQNYKASRGSIHKYEDLQPDDGPYTGPKHVVVSPMY